MSPSMRRAFIEHTPAPSEEPFYLMVPPAATDSLEPIRKWLTALLAAKVARAERDRAALLKLESDIALASQVLTLWEQLDAGYAVDMKSAATIQGGHDDSMHDDSQPEKRDQLRRVDDHGDVRRSHDAADAVVRMQRSDGDDSARGSAGGNGGNGTVVRDVRAAAAIERDPDAVTPPVERRRRGRVRLQDEVIIAALREHGPQKLKDLAIRCARGIPTMRDRITQMRTAGLVVRNGHTIALPPTSAVMPASVPPPAPLRAKHTPLPVTPVKASPALVKVRCRNRKCLRIFETTNAAALYCLDCEPKQARPTSWHAKATQTPGREQFDVVFDGRGSVHEALEKVRGES